jgi:hypothetical protein
MADGTADGDIPAELITFKYPLRYFSAALRGTAPVRIVAMGSSSTAGREDVVPYPHRLDDKAHASERMVSLIAAAAAKAKVSVFRRWALMRHWHVQNNISFER